MGGREKREQFQKFLRSENSPETVKEELGREPLLLYLLAEKHRDGKIEEENFFFFGDKGGKIEIYNQSLEWVLTKQRSYANLQYANLENTHLQYAKLNDANLNYANLQ